MEGKRLDRKDGENFVWRQGRDARGWESEGRRVKYEGVKKIRMKVARVKEKSETKGFS